MRGSQFSLKYGEQSSCNTNSNYPFFLSYLLKMLQKLFISSVLIVEDYCSPIFLSDAHLLAKILLKSGQATTSSASRILVKV